MPHDPPKRNSVALIRTIDIDADVKRLKEELAPYFGENIYVMAERYREFPSHNYRGNVQPPYFIDNDVIYVTRGFLELNRLPYFDKVGWQCGDFNYFAALSALPDYDYYWLIECDVSFQADTAKLFGAIDSNASDLIALYLGVAHQQWVWRTAMSRYTSADVFFCLYPISRISNKGVRHLFEERIKYSNSADTANGTWAVGRADLYANDESFTATILKRDGFTCTSLNDIIPTETTLAATLFQAYHPIELEHMNEFVVHPVCSGEKFKSKMAVLAYAMEENWEYLHNRYAKFTEVFDLETWESLTGLPKELFSSKDFELSKETVPFYMAKLVRLIYKKLTDSSSWKIVANYVYNNKVGVIDIALGKAVIAFDITPELTDVGNQLKVEFFLRKGVLLRDFANSSYVKENNRYMISQIKSSDPESMVIEIIELLGSVLEDLKPMVEIET
jgi:hypothetical protein